MQSDNSLEILIIAKDLATATLREAAGSVGSLSDNLATTGARLTTMTSGLAVAFAASVNNSREFQSAMTNTASLLQITGDEYSAMTDRILEVSQNATAGPQAVAQSFNEIVSGVADTTTHMAILETAIRTAEAGQADLMATTSGLVSVTNAYGASADEVAGISDVLSQTVAVGVGSLDQFVAALPTATSLAADLGISFQDVGAATAYMTTKGFTASQATTRLNAALVSILNPNEKMKESLNELGFSSGRLAVEQLGLMGVLEAVSEVAGDDLTASLGSTEALMAVTVLATDEASIAMDNFAEAVNGATDRARGIQLTSFNAQLDLLRSRISILSIRVGDVLLPILAQFLGSISTLIDNALTWIDANEQAFETLVRIGLTLTKIGPILIGVGGAIALLSSPIIPVTAAILGLVTLFETDFMGIKTLINGVTGNITNAFEYVIETITRMSSAGLSIREMFTSFFQVFEDGSSHFTGFLELLFGMNSEQVPAWMTTISNALYNLPTIAQNVGTTLVNLFNNYIAPGISTAMRFMLNSAVPRIVTVITGVLIPAIENFVAWLQGDGAEITNSIFGQILSFIQDELIPVFESFFDFVVDAFNSFVDTVGQIISFFVNDILPTVSQILTETIIPAIISFGEFLVNIWNTVRPGLEFLLNWFVNNLVPALSGVFSALVSAIAPFIETLVGLWEVVRPHLENLVAWFVTTALPSIAFFISDIFLPVIEDVIRILTSVWEVVGPALIALADWFLNTALPVVVSFIETTVIPIINFLVETLQSIWLAVAPVLQGLIDWFVSTGWPLIQSVFEGVIKPAVDILVGVLKGIWELVEPVVSELLIWFQNLGGGLETIWNEVISPAVDMFKQIFELAFTWIDTNVIQPFLTLLRGLGDILGNIWNQNVAPVIEGFKTAFSTVFSWIEVNVIQPFIKLIEGIVGIARDVVKAVENIFAGPSKNSVTNSANEILDPGNLINVQQQLIGAVGGYQSSLVTLPGGIQKPNLSGNILDYYKQNQNLPGRDFGGSGEAGRKYRIGNSQIDDEIFMARTDGNFIPNFFSRLDEKLNGNGQQINVYIDGGNFGTLEERQANAEDFASRLNNELKQGGIR